jgi:polyhydroxybutyrate depolymerase
MRTARAIVSLVVLGAGSTPACTHSSGSANNPGGGVGGSANPDLGNGSNFDLTTSNDGGPPAPAACSGKMAQPADSTWTLQTNRTVEVHVPKGYDPATPSALILNFHGYTSNGMQQAGLTGMSTKADAANFVVIYPNGSGSPTGFNGGACCGPAAMNKVDDIAFTKAILDEAQSRLCIDAKRIFVAGFSNGGFMSHRIACELADRVAAVAPVSGVLGIAAQSCTPARPIAVMDFHGTGDGTVPYQGNAQNNWPSAPDTFAGWAARNRCSDATPAQTFNKGQVTCATYSQCADAVEVTLCTIANGGHAWPGSPFPILPGTTQDISATDAMWTFFEKHPLP